MFSKPLRFWNSVIVSAFAERRIYIKTDIKTRYVAIRPAAQIGGMAAVAAILGWTGYTTSAFVENALNGRNANIQIDTMAEAYEARLAAYGVHYRNLEEQLNHANQRRDIVTEQLGEKQALLVGTANDLRVAAIELTVLRSEFETLTSERRDQADRVEVLELELASTNESMVRIETSKTNLNDTLGTLSGAMERVIAERDQATGKSARLDSEVAFLSTRINELNDRQERLVTRLEGVARTSILGLETLFGRSNVDLDRILTVVRRDYSGAGGPFSPTGENMADRDWAEGTRVASLITNLETVNLMQFAANRMPFGKPVQGGRLTSTFGPRRDPKGGARSMHTGLDIAAPRGTPIYATADGVVTFAGRQSGYGIVVKIRHAFGFETFYAHNSRARVKAGQRVLRGDRIAKMGSTGRSTGNHVHYEIRIDNEPVNPIKFIEAARDVL